MRTQKKTKTRAFIFFFRNKISIQINHIVKRLVILDQEQKKKYEKVKIK